MVTADASLLFEKDQQYPPGHCFLPADHSGLMLLARLWGLYENEVRLASSWLPSALLASVPNLKQIIAAAVHLSAAVHL